MAGQADGENKETPLIFFDEPGLAGFGSSAFITITPEDIKACLSEVFEAVHAEGGLVGVHVCANTEWSVIFDSGTDIVSFDAYSYFDKFILYPEHIRTFFQRGGILCFGYCADHPRIYRDWRMSSRWPKNGSSSPLSLKESAFRREKSMNRP